MQGSGGGRKYFPFPRARSRRRGSRTPQEHLRLGVLGACLRDWPDGVTRESARDLLRKYMAEMHGDPDYEVPEHAECPPPPKDKTKERHHIKSDVIQIN